VKALRTLALAALVLCGLALGPARPPARGAALACKDVMFIGARGSGEPASSGMGVPVTHMAQRLGKAVSAYGEKMGTLVVPYRADSVGELVPSKGEIAAMAASGVLGLGNPGAGVAGLGGAAALYYTQHARPYLASIKDGVKRTIEAAEAQLALCPESELVLAGYSQGAMAVHQAELQLQREGKEDLLDAIGGTLLLGDGDRVPHSAAKLIGGAPSGGQGVQVALHGFRPGDVFEPETTAEICVPGDIVCDFKLRTDFGALAAYKSGAQLHSGYKDKPESVYLDRAVDWLAREMGLDPSARSARRARPATSGLRLAPRGLGPVRFGMDVAQAESSLGAGIAVEEGINGCSFWTLPGQAPGTQLIAFDGRLGFVLLYARGPATTRGVKVGDGIDRLRHRYRGKLHPGRSASLSGATQRLFVTSRQGPAKYELEFDLYDGHVAFISAATKHTIETFGECA
jgi:cutinase